MVDFKFRRVNAVHPHWHCDLLLQVDGDRVVHSQASSEGRYVISNEGLIIYWDNYPQDVFRKISSIYIHDKLAGSLAPDFKGVSQIYIGSQLIDVSDVNVIIPGTQKTVRLRANTSDGDVFLQVFVVREYDSPHLPKSVSTIVDLGANIGLAAVYFALRYPGARIFSVEPDAENFAILTQNVEPFGYRIRSRQGAAWYEDGDVNITNRDETGAELGAWGIQVEELQCSTDRVSAYHLNTLFDLADFPIVDLLKIDIEGAELEIFSKGSREWLNRVNFICVETHDRFRDGTEQAVRKALMLDFEELPQSGENLLFRRRNNVVHL